MRGREWSLAFSWRSPRCVGRLDKTDRASIARSSIGRSAVRRPFHRRVFGCLSYGSMYSDRKPRSSLKRPAGPAAIILIFQCNRRRVDQSSSGCLPIPLQRSWIAGGIRTRKALRPRDFDGLRIGSQLLFGGDEGVLSDWFPREIGS